MNDRKKKNVLNSLTAVGSCFRILGILSYYIMHPFLCGIINDLLNYYYSGRVSRRFSKCGSNLIVKRYVTLYKPYNIEVGNNVEIHRNAIIATHSEFAHMKIGNNVIVGEYCHITCMSNIIIDDGVLMGKKCIISDNNHGETTRSSLLIPPSDRKIVSKGDVLIGRNVWLGDNVVVLPGVNIGEGCVIGASSVVTKSLPPYTVSVGNPAKVVKTL